MLFLMGPSLQSSGLTSLWQSTYSSLTHCFSFILPPSTSETSDLNFINLPGITATLASIVSSYFIAVSQPCSLPLPTDNQEQISEYESLVRGHSMLFSFVMCHVFWYLMGSAKVSHFNSVRNSNFFIFELLIYMLRHIPLDVI